MRFRYVTKTGIIVILASLVLAGGIIILSCSDKGETSSGYETLPAPSASAEKADITEYETSEYMLPIEIDSLSDCLNMGLVADTPDIPFNLDCIEWVYGNNKKLHIHHGNAGFNCCPEIAKMLKVQGDSIIVTEIEISGDCRCTCLLDMYYTISLLQPGVYHFKVIEPYVGNNEEQLEFTLDLINEPTGSYCVERDFYPWGE